MQLRRARAEPAPCATLCGMELVVEQKHFGPRSFFAALVAVNICVILAVDMYAPALPGIQREFGVTEAYLNLTMFAFFLFSAVGVLCAGPASDQMGRKPVMLAGMGVFAAGSFACAAASGVEALAAARSVQAVGYGIVITVESAMLKDSYAGLDLKTVMTVLQSLIIVGPAIAPFLGTFILAVAGWREIFVLLAELGAASFLVVCAMRETSAGSARLRAADGAAQDGFAGAMRAMGRGMAELVRDRRFVALALYMGVAGVPYFAFIAVVSYVILDFFAASYMTYNLVYAAISLVSVAAPFVYAALSRRVASGKILAGAVAFVLASGAALCAFGAAGPWALLLAFVPYALAEGVVRPLAFVELLDQPPHRVGAASSAANLSYTVITSVATVLATLPWPTFITGLWALTLATGVTMALLLFVRYR